MDLVGKGCYVRTIPFPARVKQIVEDWLATAGISNRKLFRRVSEAGRVWGQGITDKVVWHVVKEFAKKVGIDKLAPHDLGRTFHHPNAEQTESVGEATLNHLWQYKDGV